MKPDWENAPKWAKYLAQDECGDWYWYELEPIMADDLWSPRRGGEYDYAFESRSSNAWKNTLEEKPVEK